jgi:hypothetical protein
LVEIEENTAEAFQARHRLVRLLVSGITAGRGEDGSPEIKITYRFGPPEPEEQAVKEEMLVGTVENALS